MAFSAVFLIAIFSFEAFLLLRGARLSASGGRGRKGKGKAKGKGAARAEGKLHPPGTAESAAQARRNAGGAPGPAGAPAPPGYGAGAAAGGRAGAESSAPGGGDWPPWPFPGMGRVLGTMLGKAEAASGRAALNNDFLPAAFMWDGLRSVLAELYGREDPRDGAALGRAARSLALAGWPGRSVKSHTLGAGGASGPNAAVPCAARASYLSAGSDGRPAGQYPPGEAAFLKRARKRLSRKRG